MKGGTHSTSSGIQCCFRYCLRNVALKSITYLFLFQAYLNARESTVSVIFEIIIFCTLLVVYRFDISHKHYLALGAARADMFYQLFLQLLRDSQEFGHYSS